MKRMVCVLIALLSLMAILTCKNPLHPFTNPVDELSDNYTGIPSEDNDGDGIGQWEDVDEITLISPQEGETITELPLVLKMFQFNPEKINKYWVQISLNAENFDVEIVYDKNDHNSNECTISVENFVQNTTYYWRAKAYDGSKWSDHWSEIRSFIFAVEVGGVINPSPSDGSSTSDTTPLLNWEDVLGAIGYHVQVNTNNSFTGTSIADDTTLTQSDYQVSTPLSNNTTYYWRIKIKNTDGVWGNWSSTWNFSVQLEIPLSPSPSSSSTIGNTTPLLDWEDISSASGYHIQVSEVIDFSSAIIENDDTLTVSEHQIETPLANNTTYYWRVKIKDTNSIWGDWSSVWSFNVYIGVPVLLSPSNGSVTADTTPTFDWQDFAGATGYQIQIDNDSDFSSPIVDNNTLSISTFTPASNLSEATYYWHVKVKDSNEVWGDWCNTWNFTVDASPPTASFTVSPDWGWPISGYNNFSVDASACSDNLTPSSELQVRWDWENDGVWDTPYSTTKSDSHSYATAGTYFILLEVKDNVGLTSAATKQVTLCEYLKWGSYGTGNGQFNYPWGVSIDSFGNVYVADKGNNRIQKFDSSGNFILKWGSYGTGDGQFKYPHGVTVDSSGNVYVADQSNGRIQKFDSSGNFILKWGIGGWPKAVAVDSFGNVFVADAQNNCIQKFDSSGNFMLKWGSPGTGDGQFDANSPAGVVVDSSGNVYVADTYNHRIQKFDSSGNFMLKWGSPGTGDGQFDLPSGMAVDSSGNVYVAEKDNDRIQKFGMPP